jgi:hypothetical protein
VFPERAFVFEDLSDFDVVLFCHGVIVVCFVRSVKRLLPAAPHIAVFLPVLAFDVRVWTIRVVERMILVLYEPVVALVFTLLVAPAFGVSVFFHIFNLSEFG